MLIGVYTSTRHRRVTNASSYSVTGSFLIHSWLTRIAAGSKCEVWQKRHGDLVSMTMVPDNIVIRVLKCHLAGWKNDPCRSLSGFGAERRFGLQNTRYKSFVMLKSVDRKIHDNSIDRLPTRFQTSFTISWAPPSSLAAVMA